MNFNGMLRAIAFPMKLHPLGESPVKSPDVFKTFHGIEGVPEDIRRETASTYKRIFSEPPWNEEWDIQDVEKKMENELRYPACLTIMEGNEDYPVAGFCWSGVVPVERAARRTVMAHNFESAGADSILERKIRDTIKREKIFFLDEVAVLREFRSGMAPIQFLVRPSLELSVREGAIEGLGWTSWKSKIAPLSLYLGFSTVVAEVEGVAFLYNPDIRPLLKIAQNVNGEFLERIIRTASRLIKGKAA